MSSLSSNEINRESFEFCHSIPIVPYTQQLMNKYRVKTLHTSTPRPIQEISVSLKEIEGLKRALLKKHEKTPNPFKVMNQFPNNKYENISILSRSFPENLEKPQVLFPEKGPFWNDNKEFVNNYLKLNQQKLVIRQEKLHKFEEKLRPLNENAKNEEKTNSFNKKTTQIREKLANNGNNKRKIQSKSPFSRRFIREHSPFETIVVLQPKKTHGKICLLNV